MFKQRGQELLKHCLYVREKGKIKGMREGLTSDSSLILTWGYTVATEYVQVDGGTQ